MLNIRLWSRLTNDAFRANGITLVQRAESESAINVHEHLNSFFKAAGFSYSKFFKMDPLCKAGCLCLMPFVNYMHTHARAADGGFLLFTNSGCLMADEDHLRLMQQKAPSPAVFVYTLPNIILGEWSILSGWKGFGQCYVLADFNAAYISQRIKAFEEDFPQTPVVAAWLSVTRHHLDGILFICDNGDDPNNLPIETRLLNYYKAAHLNIHGQKSTL